MSGLDYLFKGMLKMRIEEHQLERQVDAWLLSEELRIRNYK
jgi:hypothetical protein